MQIQNVIVYVTESVILKDVKFLNSLELVQSDV